MPDKIYDLIIIGGGPGGYVAAIRGAQLGMSVAVVEQRDTLGGVCLNEGCIPSKALLDSSELFALARDRFGIHGIMIDPPRLDLARMMARKDDVVKKNTDGITYLFKKNSITLLQGTGRIAGKAGDFLTVAVTVPAHGKPEILTGKRILLATGSKAVELPGLPFDGERIVSAREALSFATVPAHLLVVGAGYIGLELGSVWNRLGSEVTMLEFLPRIAIGFDLELSNLLQRLLTAQGIAFHLETKVNAVTIDNGRATATATKGGEELKVEADKVLVAVGRRPFSEGLGAEEAGVEVDLAEADAAEDDGLLEAFQRDGGGPLLDSLGPVQVLENALGGAQRLLEDIVDAGEALDRFVQQQQGQDEAGEVLAEPRAIGPVTKPLFASLGFANGMVVKGNEVHVDTNVCASLTLGSLRPGDPFCGTFLCVPLAAHWPVDPGDGYFGCMGFSVSGESDWTPCNGSYYGPCDGAYSGPCETLVGPEPCNGDYQCGFMCGHDQYSGPGVGPSIDDLWDHPFVQGLRAYFNVTSAEDLQADVGYFVGRNLYDASAVRK